MSVTIKEVAERAGVSIGTVSNVLNRKRGEYRPDTYQRVMKAVYELGYHPNRVARNLVRRASRCLGLSFTDQGQNLGENPYLAALLDGFLQAAGAEGYNVTIYTGLTPGADQQHLSVFLDRSIDALCLVAPDTGSPLLELLAQTSLPFLVAGMEEPAPDVHWIDVDNAQGARLAVECLAAHGHTRIAHLAGSQVQKAAVLRAQAYREALADHDLPFHPGYLLWTGFNEAEAREAALALLRSSLPPSAIFAANDQVAFGALAAAREIGVRVPEELSVIGFDDIREARLVTPPLTTVRQPVQEIGRRAAKRLIELLHDDIVLPYPERVAPELILRASVGNFLSR